MAFDPKAIVGEGHRGGRTNEPVLSLANQPPATGSVFFVSGDGFGTFGFERGWLVEGYRRFDDAGGFLGGLDGQ